MLISIPSEIQCLPSDSLIMQKQKIGRYGYGPLTINKILKRYYLMMWTGLLPTILNAYSKSSGLMKRSKLAMRSEEHTSELQSRFDLVCRLLLEKKKHM